MVKPTNNLRLCINEEMLKQVQHDNLLAEQEKQEAGLTPDTNLFPYSPISLFPCKRCAFTLAEGRLACTNTQELATSCPPLETLPNKNTPVDCFCERKPKSLISRWGRKRAAFTYVSRSPDHPCGYRHSCRVNPSGAYPEPQ